MEDSAFFEQAQDAEPEGHHAHEGQGDAHDGAFRPLHGGVNDAAGAGESADEAGDKQSEDEQGGPDGVEHAADCIQLPARGVRKKSTDFSRAKAPSRPQPKPPPMSYSIQMAARLSGVSAHVIRMWERRYAVLSPGRTASNRRLYEAQDIERLKVLRALTEQGHRIGNMASLPTAQLQELLAQNVPSAAEPTPIDAKPTAQEDSAQLVARAITASKNYDSESLRRLLDEARQQLGHRGMLYQVVCPLIEAIGQQWQAGQMRPAHEHVATAVVRELLMAAVPGQQISGSAAEIIITTPSGEMHELGAMLAAATARDLGWRVTYLGPNLPVDEIVACARARQARAVALSVVYPERCPVVAEKLKRLRQLLPQGVELMVGGRAAEGYQQEIGRNDIHWIHSLPQLDETLVSLARQAPARPWSMAG